MAEQISLISDVQGTDGPKQPRARRSLASRIQVERFSGVYAWIAIIIVFAILRPDTFFTFSDAKIIADQGAITAVIALGATAALTSGAFDIAIGAAMGWAVTFVAWLMANHGVNLWLAIAIALLSGLVVGLVNGFIVVNLGVEPIIATMGTTALLTGLAYLLTSGQVIVTGIPAQFQGLVQRQLFGIPISVTYVIVLALILWYLFEHTPTGRHMYATGHNAAAAALAGIRVGRMVFLGFIISGIVSCLAGIMLTARVGSAGVNVGAPYLLPAYAAAFLGSTQVRPGHFNILGTLIAVYLIGTGVEGLQLVWPSEPWVSNVFTGLTLILAVAVGVRASKRRRV